MRAGTSAATALLRRQRQLALDVHELLQHRRRLQLRRRAVPRSRHARRAGRARQPEQVSLWYYANTDNRKALSFGYNGGHWADTKNSVAPRHHALAQLARHLVDVVESSGIRYFINHDDAQWVTNEDLDGRRAALRVRPHRPEDGVVQHALQLHDDAEPVAAGLRRAVRVGRRLLELQGAGRRPRRELRGPLPAVRLRRQRRLQHPLVPHHQRAAVGIQARARRCSWSGSRASQDDQELRRLPLRPRLRRRVLGARRTTCSWSSSATG